MWGAEMRVIDVREDGSVVVDAKGLRRIILQPEGEIAEELVPTNEARAYAKAYNACIGSGRFAEIIDYKEAYRRTA